VRAARLPVAAELGDKAMPTCFRQRASMISTQDFAQPDRSQLVVVARADRSELTPERRSELDELLASAEPPYDPDPSRWDPAIYFAINARVAANALARAGCWKEAWQVMAGAVPDDPMHAMEVAELRLLEILLDTMHRGVEAVAGRIVDEVDPLIRAGQHHARCALLDRTQQLLFMTGRTDESLRLLDQQRIAPLEQLTSMANLLTYARPNVFTLAGKEQVMAGAERMQPYADVIVGLWRRLSALDRRQPLTARNVVVWALGMTGGDACEALTSFGPDDGSEIEWLCRSLRWFGLTNVTERIAEAMQGFDFAQHPSPGYLVACLGRVEEAVDMFLASADWTDSHRLLNAIRNVPAKTVPRLVAAIDRMIDLQVGDPELTLEGPYHTAITLRELLSRRAFLTAKIRALPAAPLSMQSELAAIQAEEIIALALARDRPSLAAAHYAALPETERHKLVLFWARYHGDVPEQPLMRMLLALPEPEIRALAIAHYVTGLAQRGIILGPLL
jgi:hypothetical protein